LNEFLKKITVPIETDPVELGSDAFVDDGVILGYPTGRSIPDRVLRIGRNARLRSGTVIYGGSIIGDQLETGHCVIIREENLIGARVMVWSNSVIDYACRIGNGVRIHTNVYLAQFTEVGDNAFIAPGVTTTNDPHPICSECMQGPTIESWARIGANSTILPRVRIGKHALVGAGSVVSKDVPPRSVVMGNPARVVGDVGDLKCRWGEKEFAYPDLKETE
jgi:acetyltransferase-like isoleucine patch superfamily enzyme